MEFLVISKMKDVFFALPPSVQLDIMNTSLTGMLNLQSQGKMRDLYYSPAGYNISTLKYKTVEDWVADQALVPAVMYADHEIYPLSDGFPVMKNSIKNLKAAVKTFPKPLK
jgi:muconolactone delta-isomerase